MLNFFPKIDTITDEFVCTRIETTIDGEGGHFFGSVSKTSGFPDGYGVFKTEDWLHCGKVAYGRFSDGRKVSLNKKAKELKLVNKKSQADG